jgi:hypothetical protein
MYTQAYSLSFFGVKLDLGKIKKNAIPKHIGFFFIMNYKISQAVACSAVPLPFFWGRVREGEGQPKKEIKK